MATTLRGATDADVGFLYRLEEECMRDYAVALWGKWVERPGDVFFLAEHRIIVLDGHDIGCVAIKDRGDHLWLDKLYVASAFQGKGIGGNVIEIVKREARDAERLLRLNVLRNNPALSLYMRHGFDLEETTADKFILRCPTAV